jgi:HEAT repeat protein
VQELVVSVRTESNPLLRAEVVKTLAAFPIVQAEEGLRLAIEDPIVDVRIVACEAWSQRGGVEALRQLIETLNSDTDADVRLAATRGLARFPSSEAIRALATALNDPDPALQYAGAETLKAVSGQDYGYNISAWREFVQGREPSVAAPSVARGYWPWQWF